jgi:hypothetical protein
MRGVTGRWVRGLTDGRRLRGGVAGWWLRRRPTDSRRLRVRGLTDGRRLRGGVAGWWLRRRPTDSRRLRVRAFSDGRKDGWSSRLLHWVLKVVNQESGRVVFDVVTLQVSKVLVWVLKVVNQESGRIVFDVVILQVSKVLVAQSQLSHRSRRSSIAT